MSVYEMILEHDLFLLQSSSAQQEIVSLGV